MADEASGGSSLDARQTIDRVPERGARFAQRRYGRALSVSLGIFLLGLAWDDLVRAGWTIVVAVLISLVSGALLLWLLPRTTRFEGLVLRAQGGMPTTRSPLGRQRRLSLALSLSDNATAIESPPQSLMRASLVGARGMALTDLRPGGFARIWGERVDVVTQGDYVVAGTPIEVISDEGYRRVVRQVEGRMENLTEARSENASERG